MPRIVTLLFLAAAHISCMEMRETVERMVMVRTTGSDLQPAATGYIYKKESDGPVSVIKMGESEVMEHLSKIYEEPKSFTAPLPVAAGPFHSKEEDGKAAAFSSESKIVPVVENQEENDHHVDGIASEDYGKIFDYGKYASNFDDHHSDFDEYLKSLGYFEEGLYHGNEHAGEDDYGAHRHNDHAGTEKDNNGSKHKFEKGGGENYHSEKYETYHISGKGGLNKKYDDADKFGKQYAEDHGYKRGDHRHKTGHNKDEAVNGFGQIFDKNEYEKDHDLHDADAKNGGFDKYAERRSYYRPSVSGFEKDDSYDSGDHSRRFGVVEKESGKKYDADHSSEEGDGSTEAQQADFSTESGKHNSRSYVYKIKH